MQLIVVSSFVDLKALQVTVVFPFRHVGKPLKKDSLYAWLWSGYFSFVVRRKFLKICFVDTTAILNHF